MIRFFTILFLLSVSCFAQVKMFYLTNLNANVQEQINARATIIGTNLLSANLLYDGASTNELEFNDFSRIDLDGTDTSVGGVTSLYLDGGITTLRGVTNLQVVTPAVRLGTATTGQYLKLTDDVEGAVEFATVSTFSPGANMATSIASISAGNNVAIPSGATLLDFSATGTITGFSITGQSDGRIISIYVRSGALTLENESASSSAENRIVTGQGNVVARAGSLVTLCLVRNGAGVRRWAVFGTSTPPIFTPSSDIERSASSGYLDTVVRGASFDFSFKKLQTSTGWSADATTGIAVDTDTSVLMLSSSGATRSFHGFISGNAEGRILIVRCNTGQPYGFTLVHNSGTVASIDNKIFSSTGANVTVNPGGAIMLIHGASAGWYIID